MKAVASLGGLLKRFWVLTLVVVALLAAAAVVAARRRNMVDKVPLSVGRRGGKRGDRQLTPRAGRCTKEQNGSMFPARSVHMCYQAVTGCDAGLVFV